MEITIQLTTFGYGGESIGRDQNGRAVFVPFALPSETVRARLVEEKRGFARAELLEVLSPSPQRIAPRCSHFGRCGICAYQHLSYPDQLTAKTQILRDQLQRIGQIANPNILPMRPSPEIWNYSNQMRFQLTDEGKLGFPAADGHNFPIAECHLPEESLNALWPQIEAEAIPALNRLSLRASSQDDLMLVLEGDELEMPALELEASISAIHLSEGEALVLAGDSYQTLQFHERDFSVSGASYLRENLPVANLMLDYLLERLPLTPETILLDAYCGAGLFSTFLAPRVKRIIAIESAPSACEDFALNLDAFDNVELYEAPVEDVLPTFDFSPDIALLDPPHTGLDKRALDSLLVLRPKLIAYISGNPPTLARDAKRILQAGYTLDEITPFDLAPHTAQIESVSVFSIS